jgi:acyl carrier protein
VSGRAEFIERMVAWLNAEVAPEGVDVSAETPLFATRLLDSLRVLELIAFTEECIGRAIPDSHIRMDNFQSVARIAAVFVPVNEHAVA